jgi:hypothetical protein
VTVHHINAIGAFALLIGGCSHHRLDPKLYISDQPQAVISETKAIFVFPSEIATTFRWHVPAKGAYEGNPEYVWMVTWDINEERLGKDPDGVGSTVYWRPGGPHAGPLDSLLRIANTTLDTYCSDCIGDIPRSIPRVDPAVTVRSRNNRVILTVVGREAIRRIFPVVPDSVQFYRDVLDGNGDPVVAVKVRHL